MDGLLTLVVLTADEEDFSSLYQACGVFAYFEGGTKDGIPASKEIGAPRKIRY